MNSLLSHAISLGYIRIVLALIDAGADVNISDDMGSKPLDDAKRNRK